MLLAVALTATMINAAQHESGKEASTDAMLQRKLALFERLLALSTVAKRIERGNTVAAELLEHTQAALSTARSLYLSGNHVDADRSIDNGLRLLSRLSRMSGPAADSPQEQRRRYSELHQRMVAFTRALHRALDEKGISAEAERADLKALDDGIEAAETLAADGHITDANRVLREHISVAELALVRVRDRETIVHTLSFASPRDEYVYERDRNRSYVLLIGLLQEKSAQTAQSIDHDALVRSNDTVRKQADELAAAGDYTVAIKKLEAATEQLAQALRRRGLGF